MAVARLRTALEPLNPGGDSVLRTVGGGYLLKVEEGQLDAVVFEARIRESRLALDRGHPARATELLQSALTLWVDPPLAEVTYESFADGEIRRLQELRLSALEAGFDAELQLGHHAAVVAELDALLSAHPTREHVAGQLMLAHYRGGHQAAALQVYQDVRRRAGRGAAGSSPGRRSLTCSAASSDTIRAWTISGTRARCPRTRRGQDSAFAGRDVLVARLVSNGVSPSRNTAHC